MDKPDLNSTFTGVYFWPKVENALAAFITVCSILVIACMPAVIWWAYTRAVQ